MPQQARQEEQSEKWFTRAHLYHHEWTAVRTQTHRLISHRAGLESDAPDSKVIDRKCPRNRWKDTSSLKHTRLNFASTSKSRCTSLRVRKHTLPDMLAVSTILEGQVVNQEAFFLQRVFGPRWQYWHPQSGLRCAVRTTKSGCAAQYRN